VIEKEKTAQIKSRGRKPKQQNKPPIDEEFLEEFF